MNWTTIICIVFFAVCFGDCWGADDFVTLKNENGQAIRCEITGFRDNHVYLKREDGMTFTYFYELLDNDSKVIVRDKVIALHPPRMRVQSLANTREESDILAVDGTSDGLVATTTTSKKRMWEIEVSSHSPFSEEVLVEIYFFNQTGVTRERKEGAVKYQEAWKIELENASFGFTQFEDNGYGLSVVGKERVRIDLVVYLRNSQNAIVDSYSTSRHAQLELEKRIPGLRR